MDIRGFYLFCCSCSDFLEMQHTDEAKRDVVKRVKCECGDSGGARVENYIDGHTPGEQPTHQFNLWGPAVPFRFARDSNSPGRFDIESKGNSALEGLSPFFGGSYTARIQILTKDTEDAVINRWDDEEAWNDFHDYFEGEEWPDPADCED